LLAEVKLRNELTHEEEQRLMSAFEDWDSFRSYLAEKQPKGKKVVSLHFRSARRFGGEEFREE